MKKLIILLSLLLSLSACNDFLDEQPISTIIPEKYFTNANQLGTYVLDVYPRVITTPWLMVASDVGTDDQGDKEDWPIYNPGELKVPAEGGDWDFGNIQRCNYFFAQVNPKYAKGTLDGDDVDNAIGEMHFLRAYEYFKKLKTLGDFPIITEVQGMNYTKLEENSKRQPRSTVARFILADLDSAITLVSEKSADNNHHCRVNKDAVRLFKSRVALFEACWLKNFAGTAFVPNGPEWPGKTQNPDFKFKAGSLDAEVDWLLQQAMESSKMVVENHPTLTENTGLHRMSASDPINPYYNMFGARDLSAYDEILLWKDYNATLEIKNLDAVYANTGNKNAGPTKGIIESYLMKDGLPLYAASTTAPYEGDDSIKSLLQNRDGRLTLFLQQPGDTSILINVGFDAAPASYPKPPYLFHDAWGTSTGYAWRKYDSYNGIDCCTTAGECGRPIFRTVEAYLNYMEASYLKNGSIDATASECWKKIRARAKVSEDYQKTIDNTDMNKEAENSWGAYTAGKLIDPTLYNIRRERRCELVSEYHRYEDLLRWRSMDQMITTPYVIKGFKLWGPIQKWYEGSLITSGEKQNVSSPEYSDYYCPYHILAKHINYDGFRWTMAHYLTPIAAKHFTMTSVSNKTSTIYQNPYWGTQSGSAPTSSY